MSSRVKAILSQIDQLGEADQADLEAALKSRARAKFEELAAPQRRRSTKEGITEDDIQRAVDEVRYGRKRK